MPQGQHNTGREGERWPYFLAYEAHADQVVARQKGEDGQQQLWPAATRPTRGQTPGFTFRESNCEQSVYLKREPTVECGRERCCLGLCVFIGVVGLEPSLLPHGLVAVGDVAVGSFPVRRVELAAFALECKVHVPDQLARPAWCLNTTVAANRSCQLHTNNQHQQSEEETHGCAVGVQVMTTRLRSISTSQHVQHAGYLIMVPECDSVLSPYLSACA
jgi:hypothetical protein